MGPVRQPLFGHPQALLLDEAATHLDLDSISALNIALQRNPGMVPLATRDHPPVTAFETFSAGLPRRRPGLPP
jgi:ATPase subunit of ABC transporter with duplicated ATPase domains